MNKNTSKLVDTSRSTTITSEPVNATPSPVAQTDGDNALPNDQPVELIDVADGDASHHIPTPNMLLATQMLDVTEVNVGLGGEIGNTNGSDNWDAFLSTADVGIQSFGRGEAPGVALDGVQFGTFQRDFPAQTPATNRRFTNFNEVLISTENYDSEGELPYITTRRLLTKSLLVVIWRPPLGIVILGADKPLIEVHEGPVGGWCLSWKILLKCAKLDIV